MCTADKIVIRTDGSVGVRSAYPREVYKYSPALVTLIVPIPVALGAIQMEVVYGEGKRSQRPNDIHNGLRRA